MEDKEIIVPIVNLNGTSNQELLSLNVTALQSLEKAINDLQRAAPHGRDYQTTEPNTYNLAREQWRSQVTRLVDIAAELTLLTYAINKQGEK